MNKFLYLFTVIICLHFTTAQNSTEDVTTTDEPDTNVTTVPPTPTTPPPPEPTRGSWNVSEKNETCIKADLSIRLSIPMPKSTKYILLNPNATTGGSQCKSADGTQVLKLNQASDKMTLTFTFEKDASKKVFVKSVLLRIKIDDQTETFYAYNSTLFPVEAGHSFMCRSPLNVDLKNVTMEILYIQIQAFGVPGKYFGLPEDCPADDNVNDVVPIVVACALAALIVIVLIAYLVGRRRSRSKGYNSV